jgi:DNA-binding IscR family transcriptional regulator
MEILETVDGPISDGKCMVGHAKCVDGGCALGALLTHVNHHVRMFMASRNLTDLADSSSKNALYPAGLSAKRRGVESPRRARKGKNCPVWRLRYSYAVTLATL